MRPGTAITARPCSFARRHVMNVPLWSGHSTATTPRARPDTILLRCGNVWASGRRPNGNSLATHPPFSTMRRARARFASG